MRTDTDTIRYRIVLRHDQDVEDPTQYGWFQIVSFSNRHFNYQAPLGWLLCQYENEDWRCDEAHPGEPEFLTGDKEPHEWQPNPLFIATLSYYEHGLCRWMVGPSTVPDYGGFDTVGVAGVIAWKGDAEKREYHETMPDACKLLYEQYEKRLHEILEAVVDEYTMWCNGETYWFEVLEWNPDTEEYDIDLDSCGGFIGTEYAVDYAKESLGVEDPQEGIDYEVEEVY